MSKFWGLTVNVGKKFKQQVQEPFCISGAALEPVDLSNGRFDDKPVLLYLQQDQNDYLLCSLAKQSVLQVPLNIKFGCGQTVGFHLKGGSPKSKVHLVGYTIPPGLGSSSASSPAAGVPFKGQQKSILVTEPKSADKQKKRVSIVENEAYGEREPLDSDDSDKEPSIIVEDGGVGGNATKKLFNGVDQDSDEDSDDDDEDDIDDDDSDDDLSDSEINELQQMLLKGKYNPKTGGKLEEGEDSDDVEMIEDEEEAEEEEEDDDEEDDDDDESDEDEEEKVGQKNKKVQKSPNSQASPGKQKPGSVSNTPNKEKKGELNNLNKVDSSKTPENKHLNLNNVKTPSSAGHTPMKSFSKGGVLVNDVKVGNGQAAKLGKMVTVYYEGRLKSNNKKFDATQNGPGFRFRLGKGEVIKGWDLGIEGMKIGGKRRLVIPAQLAYGKRGAPPDIPPNSTLVFDVELKNVS